MKNSFLLYTMQRTGTNFANLCLQKINTNSISTHNVNYLKTIGPKINYNDYEVICIVRDIKDHIYSELLYNAYIYLKIHRIDKYNYETIFRNCEKIISKQIIYFNHILQNSQFYVITFENLTKNTRNTFFKLIKDKKIILTESKQKELDIFFSDTLNFISQTKNFDKKRFPRKKTPLPNRIYDDIENSINSKELKEIFDISQKLYFQIINLNKINDL